MVKTKFSISQERKLIVLPLVDYIYHHQKSSLALDIYVNSKLGENDFFGHYLHPYDSLEETLEETFL
jgi:hypothetical protein